MIKILSKFIVYQNYEHLLPILRETKKYNFHINQLGRKTILDMEDNFTLDKGDRNTTPVKLPNHFGDVIHYIIGYKYESGLGVVQYNILFSNTDTKYNLIYPMKNL